MGVLLSGPRSKAAYYKNQAYKARTQAIQARNAGNSDEADRLEDVATRADQAALDTKEQLRNSG